LAKDDMFSVRTTRDSCQSSYVEQWPLQISDTKNLKPIF